MLLEKRMKEAIEKKADDINSFIWKGNKILDENKKYQQTETRLVDMDEKELNRCYKHCNTMLYNTNIQNPGRYGVLTIINDQRNRCGIELFLRYIEQEKNIARFTLRGMISDFLSNNKEAFKDTTPMIKDAFSSIPDEYERLSLHLLMDGCLDKLGALNKKHLTRTFILRQGIWLTAEESKEFIEYNEDGSLKDRLSLIRERFNLKDIEKLFINSRGLSYDQMRAMLNLKPYKKFMDLTTTQLKTLRNKVLFNLDDLIYKQISSWEIRMKQIERVAEHNKIELK